MARLYKGKQFLSKEIRKYFSSFYLFNDLSPTKKDLIGVNHLTYGAGSPSLYYGANGIGESFAGDKYLSNDSITPTVTGFPVLLYASGRVTDVSLLGDTMIALSPWLTGYTKSIELSETTGNNKAFGSITEAFLGLSNLSKSNPVRLYNMAFILRSMTDFTLFVNGEKLTPSQSYASSFTTKNKVWIGTDSSDSFRMHGGIFSAGWGTTDPGDAFAQRLSVNPNEVIFQKMFQPRKSAGAGVVNKIPWHLLFGRVI